MKTVTVTKRIGEYFGPIDWAYDFRQHFNNYCGSDAQRDKYCADAVDKLRRLTSGGEWMATTDGGWPRFGWGKVLEVGMYDGWPWWRPVPSVCIDGPLGGEWHGFYSVTGIEPASRK